MIVILKLNKTKNHFFALFNTPNGSYDKKNGVIINFLCLTSPNIYFIEQEKWHTYPCSATSFCPLETIFYLWAQVWNWKSRPQVSKLAPAKGGLYCEFCL